MSRSEYQDAAEKTKALARRKNNKRRRILVVDDDQISLALLKQLLEVHGYETLETPKGLEAIDIARNEQPDLIMMDIRVPDMCGLEVTRLLKQDEQSKAIPIIAVTALATPEYEKKGLESGCDAYIAKPIALDHLLRTIESFFTSVPSAIGSLHIDRSPTSIDRYQVANGPEGPARDGQRRIN
jgi:two-component system cell cycle response regulator DivK